MSSLENRCWSCSCASKVEPKHSSGPNFVASKADEMMSIVTSVLSNAYCSLHDVRTANLIRRGLVLFTVGAALALVLNLLQIQRHVTLFPEEVMATLFSSAWWIPPCCGTGAGEWTTTVSVCLTFSGIDCKVWRGTKGCMEGRGSEEVVGVGATRPFTDVPW